MQKRLGIAVVVILVIMVVLAFGQQNKVPPQPNTGRFSLVAAEVHEGFGGPRERTATVFVIDTQTGKVWRWSPDYELNKKLVPAGFYGVPFEKYGDTADHRTEYPQ
jgi:hypothetical protein